MIRAGTARSINKIADHKHEIDAGQALRCEAYYYDQGATANNEQACRRHDFDRYDAAANHLIVIDPSIVD